MDALSGIAILQTQAGFDDEMEIFFDIAQTAAQTISDAERRAEALKGIAVAQAQRKKHDEAQRTFATAQGAAQTIAHERNRARTLFEIATTEARIGYDDNALQTIVLILLNRHKYLPEFASIFVAKGDNAHFKALLLPCASYLDAAYAMCGHLARLYPAQAAGIAEVIQQQEHLDKPSEG